MRIKQLALVVLCTALAVWGCQPDEDFGEAPISEQLGDKRAFVPGTYALTSVTQVDITARNRSWPANVVSRDVTQPVTTLINNGTTQTVDFRTLRLTLNADGSFTSVRGTSPLGFPASGTWSLNNNTFANQIRLVNGTDTTRLSVSEQLRQGGNLKVSLVRSQGATPVMEYIMTFTRQ